MKLMTPIFLKRSLQVIRYPGTKLCIIRKPYGKFASLPAPSRNSYFNRTKSLQQSVNSSINRGFTVHRRAIVCTVLYNVK